jgi:hypothetical protein
MGIYTTSTGVSEAAEDIEVNYEELMEAFFYDDFASCSDEEKKALIESGELALLEKKNITNRKTLVRLNKNDDISRRTTMAALQLARDNNDPLWKALKTNRIRERQLLAKIEKKYGSRASKVARVGQKEYLKNVNKPKMLKAADISHRD